MERIHFERKLAICVIMIAGLAVASLAPSVGAAQEDSRPSRPEFRYIILDSYVREIGFEQQRQVIVLLDDKAFSEDTLRKLAALLCKRYPRPDEMYAWIYTDLAQVRTPEETDYYGRSGDSGSTSPGASDNYDMAVLMRSGDDETVVYHTKPPRRDGRIVINWSGLNQWKGRSQ
ncbi:MAG TPA: hypothetical protein VJX67_03285 [Blastocatellia bacterium]|nr:hypothetical protein [Blastocatellia bacterium]